MIGIGGNIGAGKTTASNQFVKMGANYLSADQIGWQVLPEITPALKRRFGKKLMNRCDRIDRKQLGQLVFKDPKAMRYLNRLSHPRLKAKIKKAIKNEKGVMILDAALLFQWPDIMSKIDYPVLVTASTDIKARRAAKRGISRARFDRIMRMQMRDTETVKMARYIAINCSSKEVLNDQCKKIYKEIINDRNMQ
ncbi:dephospho-CoA kinase [candidate division WOR-3 bacterium RBG_13_43_14]|uniref:Dephospho-CoA kinase n=1 Tax=candidate division WOR-3 bacterium RBG_13_43_14 TaxID=1802590 RepID=A0A1F4U9H5_UNCW3|nr:MAG: dephospho-CoA kinase [candidate division WOR-3 bacterium RBG_13_43_14]